MKATKAMKASATKGTRATAATTSALALAALAGSCARQDPHPDETAKRLSALEQQVAAQQQALDDLQRKIPDLAQLLALNERLDALSDKVGRGAQPAPRRAEPERTAIYSVSVGTSPVLGAPAAKVTMVMIGEFACPYCRKAWDTVDELRKRYGPDLRVAFKSFIVHPKVATVAAQAACAANRQHKWKQMADLLWAKAFDTAGDDPHSFEREHIDKLAAEAGLDLKRYADDMKGACPAEVRADQDAMTRLGVGGTPAFYINGRYLSGAQPIEKFAALIDEELAKANATISGGVKPELYYDQEIVAKGIKDLPPSPY
jgi:protein-disulfide isomerase